MTPRGCAVTRLRLHHFRNYAEGTVLLAPGLNVLSGSNAQGKTNLLEAVATLALTRSPRAAGFADLVQWGEQRCQIEATVVRGDIPSELATRLEGSTGDERVTRTITVDGKPRTARGVLGLCPVVLFWPEDLQLVKAGPDGRRRLLDTLLSQLDPRAATHLLRYRRVLEQRNALLHRIRADGRGRDALPGFTAELVEHGSHVVIARRKLVAALTPLAAGALHDLSGGSERLVLRYISPCAGDEIEDSEVARCLHSTLDARAQDEVARGLTLVGPHRDDMEIELDGRPARHAASQGQQRSIVLACKLAEIEHVAATAGVTPVVMLDDVLSELDATRRRDLLTRLARGTQQVLVTTTEPLRDTADFTGVRHFTVEAGHVRATGDDGVQRLPA